MNDKEELTLSIEQANSLKRITKMPGWKIIEGFLNKSEEKYDKELRDEKNDDMANIKACRKIIGWIGDFRDKIRFTELSAYEDTKELQRLTKGK